MIEKKINIVNKLGLHARAASKLVSTASAFSSETQIFYNNKEADAKSIMQILMLAAKQGEEIKLSCAGEDEEEAMHAVCELIMEKFGEEE